MRSPRSRVGINYDNELFFKPHPLSYRRSIAESDNMRKRLTKQIDDAKVFGIQSFVKDLLAVADVLNKASSDITEDIVMKENSSYLKDVVEGVRLTEAQLQQGKIL